ncbi:hypothetical protein PCASD_25094 [Puccinia coronata f. sp. avenae]|uniref:Uncharacterized protein n=1 Tax=Puccinia coronata f. sp. avenae TaxID=200324 RepID=A0A2N5SLJ6_9BASI|nr:hypothetical protein PCASD_25094 [Puccinia coronata f. sp. avenae]
MYGAGKASTIQPIQLCTRASPSSYAPKPAHPALHQSQPIQLWARASPSSSALEPVHPALVQSQPIQLWSRASPSSSGHYPAHAALGQSQPIQLWSRASRVGFRISRSAQKNCPTQLVSGRRQVGPTRPVCIHPASP